MKIKYPNVGAGLVPAQIENFGRIAENIYLETNDRYKNIKLHNYQ
jgi:hypothetical protein